MWSGAVSVFRIDGEASMEQGPWMFIGVSCAMLGIPLGYALHTLLGIQGKTVIPLLRTRDAFGHSHAFMRPIRFVSHSSIQRRILWSKSAM